MKASVLQGASRHSDDDEVWTPERCFILETWNHASDPDVSLARARVPPGVSTARHVLAVDERYLVVSGEGRIEIEGIEPRDVRCGDVVLIPAGRMQRIHNTGDEHLVFLCICTPRFQAGHYQDREEA